MIKQVAGVCAVFGLACGSGAGAGAAPPDAGATDAQVTDDAGDIAAPQVRLTSPDTDATDVALDTNILVSFTEPMEANTLNATSMTLAGPSWSVSGTVTAGDADATLVPDRPLFGETTYTATVASSVTDVAGNSLGADYTWSFTTRARTWFTPSAVATPISGVGIARPQIAIDAAGDAVAVWTAGTFLRTDVWAAQYRFGEGWTSPALLETDDTGTAEFVQLAAGGDGSAIAVWQQHDGTRTNIWACRFDSGSWGGPQLIETNDVEAEHPRIAMDSAGGAVVVWEQIDVADTSAWANRYDPATGWGTAQVISAGALNASWPLLAVDGAGNAIVVWSQAFDLWTNRYEAGVGWTGAASLQVDARNHKLASNVAGDMIVLWQQDDLKDGVGSESWARRYTPGMGWQSPELIANTGGFEALEFFVIVDAIGNATAVWLETYPSGDVSLWLIQDDVATGWTAPTQLDSEGSGPPGTPSICKDDADNLLVAWTQGASGSARARAKRYRAGTGWSASEPIDPATSGDSSQGHVGCSPTGNAIAAWVNVDASGPTSTLWAASFE